MCSYSATHAFAIELPILISGFYQALEVQDFGYETDLIRVSLAEHCSPHGFQHISEQTRKLPNARSSAASAARMQLHQPVIASQHRSCLRPAWLHIAAKCQTRHLWQVSTEVAFNLLGCIAARCQKETAPANHGQSARKLPSTYWGYT